MTVYPTRLTKMSVCTTRFPRVFSETENEPLKFDDVRRMNEGAQGCECVRTSTVLGSSHEVYALVCTSGGLDTLVEAYWSNSIYLIVNYLLANFRGLVLGYIEADFCK